MPGYYVHLAASNSNARNNYSFIKGVIMPDLLKAYLKKYGLVKTRKKYNEMKSYDMPDFSFFEKRVQEKETENSSDGLHYGKSANPNIHLFWDNLTDEEKESPFFRGYLWHLLTDMYVYQTLEIYSDIDINLLHEDWDRINAYINIYYPAVELPKEVRDLNLISYKNDNVFNYVDPINIKFIIDYLNQFDILNGDVDSIINEIMNEIKKNKSK